MDVGGGNAPGLAPRLNFLELVVYDDGRSIIGDANQTSWEMFEGKLTGAELDRVRLLGGEVLSSDTIRFHPGTGVADAVYERLIGWSGSQVRVTGISERTDDSMFDGSPDAARRDAWNELIAVVSGAVTARGHRYGPSAVAVFTEPQPADNGQMLEWPGPDLTSFGNPIGSPILQMPSSTIYKPQLIPADVRCGLVNDVAFGGGNNDLLFKIGEERSKLWVSGDATFDVVVRPLLPHETTCDDAFTV